MRIIGGDARGRVLKSREGKGTRPTDSRSREALFNILAERVIGARFLDLYAGSGSIGLEALSRGALHSTFIEQNAVASRCIKENLKSIGYADRGEVWTANVKGALDRLEEGKRSFDIIFADPPFTRESELQEFGAALDKCARLLHNVVGRFNGLLIVQHHWKASLPLPGRVSNSVPGTPAASSSEISETTSDDSVAGDSVAGDSAAGDSARANVDRNGFFELVQQRRSGESVLTFLELKYE